MENLIGQKFNYLTVKEQVRINGKPYWKCICDCGKERLVLNNRLVNSKTVSCGCSRLNRQDLIGKKIGKLTCLEFVGKTDYNHLKWRWRCECGREKIITGNCVRYGGIKGCGICTKRGQQSVRWTGVGEIGSTWWRNIQKAAERREMEFKITKQEAWELFLKQNRICALTGEELRFTEIGTAYGGDGGTASIDRIDNEKGYTLDNIWWVHRDINIMKFVLPLNKFYYTAYLSVNKENHPKILIEENYKKGYKLISGSCWNRIIKMAESRDIQFNLDIKDAWDIYARNGGYCAITGMKLQFEEMPRKNYKTHTASLDRIDSNGIYEKNNVQWVHKTINRMKWDIPDLRFIELLKKVYEYNKDKYTDEFITNCEKQWAGINF